MPARAIALSVQEILPGGIVADLAPAWPLPASGGEAVTPAETAAMLRAVFVLFERWELSAAEARCLLGAPAEATLRRWQAGDAGAVPHDTVFRLGTLLGIHKALRYMFTDPGRGYAWVRRPNAAFGGRTALDRMMQGAPTDLAAVRAYLDAERAGW